MSEPMFKAWDNKNKRWIHKDQFNIYSDGTVHTHGDLDGNTQMYDATLCRSTGHKDIRNNVIFEHDILKDFMGRIYFVKYRSDYAMFMHQDTQGYQGAFEWMNKPNFEIIGNIFENDELLEPKQ